MMMMMITMCAARPKHVMCAARQKNEHVCRKANTDYKPYSVGIGAIKRSFSSLNALCKSSVSRRVLKNCHKLNESVTSNVNLFVIKIVLVSPSPS